MEFDQCYVEKNLSYAHYLYSGIRCEYLRIFL